MKIPIGGQEGIPLPPPLPQANDKVNEKNDINLNKDINYYPEEPDKSCNIEYIVPNPPPNEAINPTRNIPTPPTKEFKLIQKQKSKPKLTIMNPIEEVQPQVNDVKEHEVEETMQKRALIDTDKLFSKKRKS